IMESVVAAAGQGMPVLGICNGFQILCEAHLLPGALIRNDHQHFICRDQELVVENTATAWTGDYERGQTIRIPLKNGEGGYVATEEVLDELESSDRVVFRYQGLNPNGSLRSIAGITNEAGNVVGLMAHPEHAVEAGFGPEDGRAVGRQPGWTPGTLSAGGGSPRRPLDRPGRISPGLICRASVSVRLRAADGPARGRPAACRPLQSSAQSSPTAVSRVLFAACRGTAHVLSPTMPSTSTCPHS